MLCRHQMRIFWRGVIITLQHVAKKAFQGGDELGDVVGDIDIYTLVFNKYVMSPWVYHANRGRRSRRMGAQLVLHTHKHQMLPVEASPWRGGGHHLDNIQYLFR